MSKLRIYNADLMNKLLDNTSGNKNSFSIKTQQSNEQPRIRLKSLIKKGLTLDWNKFNYSQPLLPLKTKTLIGFKPTLTRRNFSNTHSIKQKTMQSQIKRPNFFKNNQVKQMDDQIPILSKFEVKQIQDSLSRTRQRFQIRLKSLNHTKYQKVWKKHFKDSRKL